MVNLTNMFLTPKRQSVVQRMAQTLLEAEKEFQSKLSKAARNYYQSQFNFEEVYGDNKVCNDHSPKK